VNDDYDVTVYTLNCGTVLNDMKNLTSLAVSLL